MLLPHGTVIALVDGEKFELLRNAGQAGEPDLVAMPAPKLDEHNRSSGLRHHSSAGNPAGSLLDEDAHAAAVAAWLNAEVIGHRIETLVVIAAPRTLGELRRHWHRQTGQALLKELDKDLLGRPAPDILLALREKH